MTGVYSGLQETVVPKASDRICVVCPRDLVTYVKKIRYRTAFVAALFDSIVGSMSTWGGGEVVGITSEDLVTYRGSRITDNSTECSAGGNKCFFIISCICAQKQYVDFRS